MGIAMRVVLWGLLFCFPVGVHAAEQNRSDTDRQAKAVEVGVGLICNSEEQVERFLALRATDQSPETVTTSIEAVNAEAQDPTACAVAAVAFVRADEGKSVPAPGGLMKITQVVILATQTPDGWQATTPILQFTAIFEKLEEA